MTREELLTNVEWCLTEYAAHPGSTLLDAVMEHVDSYAAAERADIEQQIAAHVERRLVAERERIAQAIEAEGRNYDDTRTNSAPVVVRMLVVAAYDHSAKVARIARAEQ